jgi:hypothetical protein
MRKAFATVALLATVLCATILPPARAEIRILASPGGQVGPFLDLFDRVKASGERVVIDGPCLSACTLVLSVVPDDRICVTRRAILGFHAARSVDRRGRMYAEPEASVLVLEAYPAPVRGWIRRRGGLNLAPAIAARTRARGDLSVVPVKDDQASSGQLTIQGIPNWSTPMPNPLEKKVLPNGMLTLPPSHSALNRRSASAGSSTCNETENPCG